MRILVTGGTGTAGRWVVRQLLDDGSEVRVLSRRPRPDTPGTPGWVTSDLLAGQGLEEAVAGADAIVHCASDSKHPGADPEAAGRLIEAARRAGAPHLVYISIVGVDRVPLRYYRAKLRVEGMVERSELPWTILRATQFHDLVFDMFDRLARLPVLPVPAETSDQPVDAPEVAARLAELARGPARGRMPDLGGPEVRDAGDLARTFLRARDRRRPVLPLPLPGRVAAAWRRGWHLAPDHADGRTTWEEYLALKVARP
jgi:uncharacterized protein YbjT (DUF2867 family)